VQARSGSVARNGGFGKVKSVKSKRLFLSIVAGASSCLFTPFCLAGSPFEVLATFDYPNGDGATAYDINDHGLVVGGVDIGFYDSYGVLRSRNGHLSHLILEPNDTSTGTFIFGINNLRHLSGFYGENPAIGFLEIDGVFTDVNVPDATQTYVRKLNDADNYCGSYITVDGTGSQLHAFVNVAGQLISFSVPGGEDSSDAWGMNNLNQVVGNYTTSDGRFHGFLRDADGTLTYPIEVTKGTTELEDVNDRGWMVGTFYSGAYGRGVLFRTPASFATFLYPGAISTNFYGINNEGLICGSYYDGQAVHGLIVRVK
jgi:uncharacterized membrane protein